MLKKMICGLLALGLFLPSLAEAAKRPAKKTAKEVREKVEAQGEIPGMGAFLLLGPGNYGIPVNAGFEMAVGETNTWNATLGFSAWGDPTSISYSTSYTSINVGGGFKWWIGSYLPGTRSRAMQGIFVGPELKYSMVNMAYTYNETVTNTSPTYPYYTYSTVKRTENLTANLFGGGAQGGYQWMFPNNFYVAGLLDVGYMIGAITYKNYAFPMGGTFYNVLVKGGYAF